MNSNRWKNLRVRPWGRLPACRVSRLLCLLILPLASFANVEKVSFNREIRPILAEHCLTCHGPDKETRKADLRLDDRDAVLRGVQGRPTIVPGKPDASELMKRITTHDEKKRMPIAPAPPLDVKKIETLRRWIVQGAEYEPHWSWTKLTRPAAPSVKNSAWPANDADRFLLAALEEKNLKPAADADPATLLRRLTLDLTGLPPTVAELESFLADNSPDAWSKTIDRLLASPRYGERWARHWLDLVRYAETYGHEFDYEIPDAWKYRDYVVRAFNANIPYDRFVAEHIAGDLLPQPRVVNGINEAPLGTTFWLLPQGTHAPVDVAMDEAERVANQIEVFGKTFLGVTLACARCHDHKFDALTARDYYAVSGYIKSARRTRAFLDPGGKVEQARTQQLAARREIDAQKGSAGGLAPPPPPDGLKLFAKFDEPVPRGWRTSGHAFARNASEVPAFGLRGDKVVALERGIATSDAAGPQFAGTLRSPSFVIEHDAVHLFVRGVGVTLRCVVDGYTLLEEQPLLFERTQNTKPDTRGEWNDVRLDVAKYKGRRGYIEILDEGRDVVDIAWIAFGDDRDPALKIKSAAGPDAVLEPLKRQAQAIVPVPERALVFEDGSGWDDRVHLRGNPKSLGTNAPRSFIASLAPKLPPAPAEGSGRLELANAITSPENPLGARVMANRIWMHLMGRGLAPTPDDLGALGVPPTNPALLDWLASEFRTDWDIKRLIKLIVTSRAYRMSTIGDAVADARDPANELFHKAVLKRMDAESLRDSMLMLSGRLDPAMGGPSVPTHLTEFMTGRGKPGKSSPADGDGRRSLYLATRRNFPDSFLCAFDLPVPTTTVGRRNASNVPAQGLALMNSPLAHGEATRWGERVAKEAGAPESRAAGMIRAAFARDARPDETKRALEFLREASAVRDGDAWTKDAAAWSALAHVLFNAKEFVFVD